jgi:hypothetical protein
VQFWPVDDENLIGDAAVVGPDQDASPMSFILQPWQLLLCILAGWVHQQQQLVIQFQDEEIRALLAKLGKKRVLLTDDQRRRLAVKGKLLGRKALSELTTSPNELWMKQIARNLTDPFDGFLLQKRYLLMDRDGKFSTAFREILENEGVEPVLLPPRSPNLNAHLERFHRSLKEELLERMIFFGETALRNAITCFLQHYHTQRNHQGLANQIIHPGEEVGKSSGEVRCRELMGGMLRYYYRQAA